MTGKTPGTYTKCTRELAAIAARNDGFTETPIHPETELHLFISDKHWKSEILSDAAFGDPGLSVRAAGGAFPKMSQTEIKRQMLALQEQLKEHEVTFVGAVSIKASDVFDNNETLRFEVRHDPNEAETGSGKRIPQAPNHVQIVCDKRAIQKRVLLREKCTWSLHPDEIDKVKVEPDVAAKEDEPFPHAVAVIIAAAVAILICLCWIKR